MSNRSSVDERTSAPSEASRRGAHRARPRAVPSGLPIIAGVAVILLVIGSAYFGLRDTSLESKGTVSAADAEATPGASSTASPSASRSAAAGPSASATRSATTTRTQAPVTKNVRLAVLNSVSVQGLAAKAQATLVGKGWTVTRTGNSTEKGLATTKVYYGRANLRATARQIARDLDAGQAQFSAGTTSGLNIIVVLGQDAV